MEFTMVSAIVTATPIAGRTGTANTPTTVTTSNASPASRAKTRNRSFCIHTIISLLPTSDSLGTYARNADPPHSNHTTISTSFAAIHEICISDSD